MDVAADRGPCCRYPSGPVLAVMPRRRCWCPHRHRRADVGKVRTSHLADGDFLLSRPPPSRASSTLRVEVPNGPTVAPGRSPVDRDYCGPTLGPVAIASCRSIVNGGSRQSASVRRRRRSRSSPVDEVLRHLCCSLTRSRRAAAAGQLDPRVEPSARRGFATCAATRSPPGTRWRTHRQVASPVHSRPPVVDRPQTRSAAKRDLRVRLSDLNASSLASAASTTS